MPQKQNELSEPFHVLTKPIGAICNLACDYCFYLEKEKLYPSTDSFRMTEETLATYIKAYIEAHPGPEISFGWQGGEPTLMGLDFFRRVVELQEELMPADYRFQNSLQTNGILLDAEWCEFLHENDFLIGLSLDGPAELHDAYRRDRKGDSTHQQVMEAMQLLKTHDVAYNILCVVNTLNVRHPLSVYRFFRDQGAEYVQFIPLVEPVGGGEVTQRTVSGQAYGAFLIEIFNEWMLNDFGQFFVQLFEEAAMISAGFPPGLCVFSETCGRAVVLEHNGDLYSCDHFVEPDYFLGNIHKRSIPEMLQSEKQIEFGNQKKLLPRSCRECEVRHLCNGGCPKNRLKPTAGGGEKINHLCSGYKRFFQYVQPFMNLIAKGFKREAPWSRIEREMREKYSLIWDNTGRNDPCPCGSGRKYKQCCLG